MRPGQNRRMRNRNRKAPNPLTKTFESNGPDVKVRGTAQHIAEKYVQLSRDAHASGDPVAAENYLQHAEHYLRIILTAQAQYQQNFGLPRSFDDDQDDSGEDDGFEFGVQGYGAPQPETRFGAHNEEGQGQSFAQPRERSERSERPERSERHSRSHDRYERHERPERMERQDRPDHRMERQERPERIERQERPERMDRRERFRRRRDEISGLGQQPGVEDVGGNHPSPLPAFLTTPIRTVSNNDEQPVRPLTHDLEIESADAAPRRMHAMSVEATETEEADKPAPRTRRRRAPVAEVAGEAATDAAPAPRLRATRTRRKSVDDVPVAE